MEVTTDVVGLGKAQVLITNNGPDDLYVGEVGQDQADWYTLVSGTSVTIKAYNNEIGVVSFGVSDVGILVGGTGVFPPSVEVPEVDLSAYVAKSAYDANTILVAHSDNTPVPVSIATNKIVGRGNSGNIKELSPTETIQIIGTEVYTQAQTINPQTGTSYTIDSTDAGKMVSLNNVAAITVSVPQDSDETIAIGTYVDLYQLGAGQVTVQAGSGATLRVSGLTAKARAQYSRFAVQKVSANTWVLFGDLAAS